MKKILLVDDALRVRLQLREILDGRSGWRVLEARDGEAALAVLHGLEPPQACVFGQGTGDGDGPGLLKRLRDEGERSPFLRRLPILLAVPEEEAEAVAASSGLDAAYIVTRPFNAERVVAALERALALG